MGHIDSLGAFLIVIINIIFWSLIFLGRAFTPLARSYFWWAFFITLWAFGYGITLSGALPYETTLVWNKYCQAMAAMIGPFFFKFSCDVAGRYQENRSIFRSYLIFGIVNALALFFTPLYVVGLWSFGSYTYQPLGGPLYIVFTLFFMWCTMHSYVVVALNYKKVVGLRKKHMILFLIATGVAYFGGITLFFQGFKLPLPTTGVYLIVGYVFIIGYSILKYKFMDIEVIVKKTLVFAGLVSFVFGIFALMAFLLREVVGHFLPIEKLTVNILSVLAIVAGYEPLRRYLVEITDRYLFQKRNHYARVLREASRDIALVSSLKVLTRRMLVVLMRKARTNNAVIYARMIDGEYFEMKGCGGYKKQNRPQMRFKKTNILIRCLEEEQGPVTRASAEEGISRSRDSRSRKEMEALLALYHEMRAEVMVPSYIRGENGQTQLKLQGFLVLGGKKSDEEYFEEDLDMLATLAQEHAIAFENARLYDEAIERNLELQRINQELMDTQSQLLISERKATMVGFAKAIGHEVNNALVSIDSGAMFARRDDIPELKQIYESQLKDKLPLGIQRKFEKLVDNLEKRAVKSSNGSHRIQVVIQTLTNILKETREGFEEVNFRMLWEEAVAEVNLSTYEENLAGCKIESDIPKNLILRVNQGQIQRVLVNLIKNAYEAMSGVKDRRICVRASYDTDPQFKGMAHIEVEDNGPGIPEELIAKVFAQGFSTKPKPKAGDLGAAGQGQGLFVCKHIVESAHKGTIEVQSTQGQGTVFILRLPAVGSEDAEENPGIG